MNDLQVGLRIRELRGGKKQGEFARQVGISQSLLSAIESGKRRATRDVLERIRIITGVSLDWLLTGKAEPWPKLAEQAAESAAGYAIPLRIPIQSTAMANPAAMAAIVPPKNAYIEIRPGTVCIEVKDDSMSPVAWPDQCVLCDPHCLIKDGDLVVVKIEGRAQLFKRVYHDKKHKEYTLYSVNPAKPKPPLDVPEEKIEYIYKVIGTIYE